jgi:hypothetical protein
MSTVVVEDVVLQIPAWVKSLRSFRRWARDPSFPETIPVWWLRGEVWADMSKQQVLIHAFLKGEIFRILANLVAEAASGIMLPDGPLLTNEAADISGNPDAQFLSTAALEAGDVRLVEGKSFGLMEVVGTPDMVLEVVSESSIKKDYEVLMEAYWDAGIGEYWIVDARESPASFDIHRHTENGYVATRKRDGWVKSQVFGKAFRLMEVKGPVDHVLFRLEVR